MRHIWGIASALGLFALVIFGTWACLTASTDDPGTSTSALVALAAGGVTAISLLARGDGAAALAKARRVIGGLGLVVAPVTGFLTLLALGVDPTIATSFLFVTLVALAAWAQGIAAQIGLSFRVSFTWLVTLVLFGVVVVTIGGLLVSVLVSGLGWESRAGTRVAFLAVFGLVGVVLAAWANGRPDRLALPGSVDRAALGRARPGDVELLAGGPGPILRRSIDASEARTADARLAAADARLAEIDADPGNRDHDLSD